MEMTIDSDIIRELRAKANWSQEDLAAASGLSLRTIQRVEKDGAAALETQKALAAAFGLRPQDLARAGMAYEPGEMRVGTGLLIIWIGIAWFFDLGLAMGLIGVGCVYIAGQLLRLTWRKRPVLWELVATGVVCLAAGVASLMGLEIRLGAVLLVGVGCLLVFYRRRS
jgi:transcriptional regulator with XRE-family HTH domain